MADPRTGAAAPILPAALAASPQTPTTTAPEPRELLQELSGLMQESGFGPDHPWCMAVAASLAAHPVGPAAAASRLRPVNIEPPGTSGPNVSSLRAMVETIDKLSQDGFSQISATAQLALRWLETPEGYRHLEVIAQALTSIHAKAEYIQNSINGEAEGVGCNYTDAAERRRQLARADVRTRVQGGRHAAPEGGAA